MSWCLLVPLCLVPIRAYADTTEDIFGRAVLYAVQIKAAVPVPFEGEEQGAWSGAGFLVDKQRGWIMTNAHVTSRSPSTMEVGFKNRDFLENFTVVVKRGGDTLRLKGSLDPKPFILERKGVYFSGILFGHFYYRDRKVMPIGEIMVHSVQKGSIGNLSNIEKGDILDGADGQVVRSLEDLYRGLGRFKDHEKITLRLKRFADPPVDSIFEYIEQTIKMEDLRWVSQEKRS